MTRLNGTARSQLVAAGITQREWTRRNFGWTGAPGTWAGDKCGCPDDRCIGFHHDGPDDCECLPALLEARTVTRSAGEVRPRHAPMGTDWGGSGCWGRRNDVTDSTVSAPKSATFGSLFSGIGGLDLGLERAGWRCLWHSEIDPYAAGELAYHWPDVPNLGDVTTIDWSTVEHPTLIAGGFPCQDISRAGLKAGITGSRSGLWKSMVECVRQLRPRYVLVENVPDLLVRGFDVVTGDLHLLGFDAEWSVVPACAMGASHSRPRLFLLAYPKGAHEPGALSLEPQPQERWAEHRGGRGDESRPGRWIPEPAVDRMADGLPRRVVFGPLAGLGNAVVPPVAEWIGSRIMEIAA